MAEVVITGCRGQLGKALVRLYPRATAVDHQELDISSQEQVQNFNWSGAKTILNAAAYTRVDEAETAEGMTAAWQANVMGVANLANIARQRDLTLVHISTDYVFDGSQNRPYRETDVVSPRGIYAATKAASDLAAGCTAKHYILRSALVIGDGPNFVRAIIKQAQTKGELGVVNDQTGRPTFTEDMAAAIKHLVDNRPDYGIYNLTNDGDIVSWAGLARAIIKQAGLHAKVKDINSQQYFAGKAYFAPRPANSALDLGKIKATGLTIRSWQAALKAYIEKEQIS